MKTGFILIVACLLTISIHAQTATIVEENKLWIPAEAETNRFVLSKSDLNKIEFISSELGEVQGYKISFKLGDLFFIKDMTDNTLQKKIKEYIIQSGAGTMVYLEMNIKDRNSDAILHPKYEYVLTFE